MSEPKLKGNRKVSVEQAQPAAVCERRVLDEWPAGLARLGVDVEQLARQTGALRRRRALRSAGDLLRLVLAYSVLDLPLRQVGAWASVLEVAELSDVAVRKRLLKARAYVSQLVGQGLGQVRLSG